MSAEAVPLPAPAWPLRARGEVLARLVRHPTACLGGLLLAAYVGVAIFAPVLSPADPGRESGGGPPAPPGDGSARARPAVPDDVRGPGLAPRRPDHRRPLPPDRRRPRLPGRLLPRPAGRRPLPAGG